MAVGERFLQLGQVPHHPVGHAAGLDEFPERLEFFDLGVAIFFEQLTAQHCTGLVVQAIVLHEGIVKVKRHGVAAGHGALGEIQRVQRGEVGGLHSECC